MECWKREFETHEEAVRAAKAATKNLKKHMIIYLCPECGMYHYSKYTRKQYLEFKAGKRGKRKNKKKPSK